MEKYSITENEAYGKIRKLSMNNQCSILETSKKGNYVLQYIGN
ncbi:ANTAR domain-containing protein [Clostridium sp. JNZ X4-2]